MFINIIEKYLPNILKSFSWSYLIKKNVITSLKTKLKKQFETQFPTNHMRLR
jgi:hypothetical protein